jgi:hypothetical protein
MAVRLLETGIGTATPDVSLRRHRRQIIIPSLSEKTEFSIKKGGEDAAPKQFEGRDNRSSEQA